MSHEKPAPAPFVITVRPEHCDAYEHLNNAACFSILEQARWFFLGRFGFSKEEVVQAGFVPIILSMEAQFRAEVLAGEEIQIETCAEKESSRTFKLHQDLKRGDKLCVRAVFRHGVMNLKDRKIVVLPDDWQSRFF